MIYEHEFQLRNFWYKNELKLGFLLVVDLRRLLLNVNLLLHVLIIGVNRDKIEGNT